MRGISWQSFILEMWAWENKEMILNFQNQEELTSPWAPPAAFLPSPVGTRGWVGTAFSHIRLPLFFGELVHPLAKENTQAN